MKKLAALIIVLFVIVGIYAPFLASSKPLFVIFDGKWYFPLFRYLFYSGFYTKKIDLFFNVLMFTLPIYLFFRRPYWLVPFLSVALFAYLLISPVRDPAWGESNYKELNAVLRYRQRKSQHENFVRKYGTDKPLRTLWQIDQDNLARGLEDPSKREFLLTSQEALAAQSKLITFEIMPLLRPFHWEDDAGGQQALNKRVKWYDLTRINRKDLVASLIFGVRISLIVGMTAVLISLVIGIPIGAIAAYYGGRTDIWLSRFIEIWEAMPTFFMLLMLIAITQSKSIFLVVAAIGVFGWTAFSRYLRAEVLKQRSLPYVEACHAMGFRSFRILFHHILPNAIPPLLTLLPFSMMAAITSEAGLSFLGLGEEGSTSWGVLMDEGRTAFPGESYLLWPPAILLTVLLIAIAIVGDALRDKLDPKMRA